MKPIRFLPSAEKEMLEAADYYDHETLGRGRKFLVKVNSAFREISRNPDLWPIIDVDIRRCLIGRYPYAI